ncbi:MAG: Xaa-Pro peptidase family protein [Nannocystaceae bacterium]
MRRPAPRPAPRSWSRRDFLGGLAAAGLVGCRAATTSPGPTSAPEDAANPGSLGDFSALAGRCDGVSPIAAAEYEARQERARARCREQGIHGLVCEAGPSLRYFTGVRWGLSERPLLFVLPVRGDPFFVAPAFEVRTLAESAGDARRIVPWEEHQSPYAAARQGLGGAEGTFDVDAEARSFVVDGLRDGARIARASGPSVIRELRARKSPTELALLRRANEATQAALHAVFAGARIGEGEPEIAAKVHAALAAAGLVETWALVLAGPNASFPHGTSEARALQDGDTLLIDAGGALHGYRSDITRTALVGAVPAETARAWTIVRDAQAAAFARMRPGAVAGLLDAAARATIVDGGHGPDYRRFTHRLGHGIGLQVHEWPYLVREASTVLEAGMTMSVEPGIYVPGSFGIRLEDIVAITDDGVEIFGERAIEAPRISI